jgi:hypothetical protein
VDQWQQIEELEFILMRMQVVVLACQVENVPTFSSIPIWITHLMKILTVYQEDNEIVAQYKHLTSQVHSLSSFFRLIVLFMASIRMHVGFVCTFTVSEGTIRMDIV